MRQGSNVRRPRGRPNRKQHGGQPRGNNFDSHGPDGRVRGNAHQVYEKYISMARDAASAGDRIMAETYYQHAEHYFRISNSSTDPAPARPDNANGHANGAWSEAEGEASEAVEPNGPQPGSPPPCGPQGAQPAVEGESPQRRAARGPGRRRPRQRADRQNPVEARPSSEPNGDGSSVNGAGHDAKEPLAGAPAGAGARTGEGSGEEPAGA